MGPTSSTYEHFCVIFYSLIWVLEVLLSSDHHQSHLGNEQKNLQKKSNPNENPTQPNPIQFNPKSLLY